MTIDWQALSIIIASIAGAMGAYNAIKSGSQDRVISGLRVLLDELRADNKRLLERVECLETENEELRKENKELHSQLEEVLKEQRKKWKTSSLT